MFLQYMSMTHKVENLTLYQNYHTKSQDNPPATSLPTWPPD